MWYSLLSVGLLTTVGLAAAPDCDLSSAASLTRCVRGILSDSANQPALRRLLDPLPLKDINETIGALNWSFTGVRVHGLSEYRIEHLEIRHSEKREVTVRFAARWRRLLASGAASFSLCNQVLDKKLCVSFDARPRVRVEDLMANMETRLQFAIGGERLKVTPVGTRIGINVPRIYVTVNLVGFLGVSDKLLKYPSNKFAKRLAKQMWVKHRKKVEELAKKHMNRLIEKHLSPKLETLLKGIAP